MKKISVTVVIVLLSLARGTSTGAQQTPTPGGAGSAFNPNGTIASQLNQQLSFVEEEVVGAAKAMPEDKYSFVPANGEFKGVRNFGQQVIHVATANYLLYGAIVPDDPTAAAKRQAAPSAQTKDQILQYLQDSFAFAHKAIGTIDAENMLQPVKRPPNPFASTNLELAVFGCSHGTDIYGQMVEYLRMNGIVPPFTANRPGRGTSQPAR
jgi:hypothetical protein